MAKPSRTYTERLADLRKRYGDPEFPLEAAYRNLQMAAADEEIAETRRTTRLLQKATERVEEHIRLMRRRDRNLKRLLRVHTGGKR